MFRDARYSLVATNYSCDAGRRGDISHETLRRQWFMGSRREKQREEGGDSRGGTAERRRKNARSGITHLSCILLSILNENPYLIFTHHLVFT